MTTKERIINESLTLFSVKGYKGTSVKDIADAVGIKDSSLYKHFRSKQEILNEIMKTIRDHIEKISNGFGLPSGMDFEKSAAFYTKFDQESIVKFSENIFLFYLKDDLMSKFWRIGIMEQFHNEEVYSIFRKFFLEDGIKYQTQLFGELIKQDVFINVDPEVMAVSYYTPFFFLLSKYSGVEGKDEEALEMLDKQCREFYRVYRK